MDRLQKFSSIALIAGAIALLAIAALSLVPGEMRPHTAASKSLEHFTAYFAAAFVLSVGLGKNRSLLMLAAFLSIYSGALELAQTGIPGRDGNFYDFVVSSSGAIVGCLLAWTAMRALPKIFA